ncbi:Uncharacterized protein Rs2_50001 [Raphanus sativus]|nr:Uncharacterized protein Rs2_50001 [Raphanus sativus]
MCGSNQIPFTSNICRWWWVPVLVVCFPVDFRWYHDLSIPTTTFQLVRVLVIPVSGTVAVPDGGFKSEAVEMTISCHASFWLPRSLRGRGDRWKMGHILYFFGFETCVVLWAWFV